MTHTRRRKKSEGGVKLVDGGRSCVFFVGVNAFASMSDSNFQVHSTLYSVQLYINSTVPHCIDLSVDQRAVGRSVVNTFSF